MASRPDSSKVFERFRGIVATNSIRSGNMFAGITVLAARLSSRAETSVSVATKATMPRSPSRSKVKHETAVTWSSWLIDEFNSTSDIRTPLRLTTRSARSTYTKFPSSAR